MLHEVIMTLAGYSGDFLQKVLECNNFVDPAESIMLKKVISIASEYSSLKKFTDDNVCIIGLERSNLGNQNSPETTVKQPFGIYLAAFCNGLQEVLVAYNSDLVEIEDEALRDPYLPLLTVINKVEEHAKVFEFLNSVIKQPLPQITQDFLAGSSGASESFTSQDDANGMLSPELQNYGGHGSSHKFAIQYNMLPSYIIPTLAQKVLFIGETIALDQVKLMKDFFLLGRGELFLEFIRLASPILQSAPVGTSTRDVNEAFHTAARKIFINDDTVAKFSFILPGKSELKEAEKKDKNLKEFKMQGNSNRNVCFSVCVSDPAVWNLRNRLMFLVDNLQYYLQVDVLESQYAILQNALQATKDFEQVQKAHTTFQVNILSQSFLITEEGPSSIDDSDGRNNPVQQVLTKILNLSEKFCASASQWTSDLNETQLEELHELVKEYERLAMYLLQLLTDLSLHPCGSHLLQLLLRLDFNRWFSINTSFVSP
ncbi:hypothetical protein C0J52_01399 [Blattella germanica]|nr:hypothetical protein C0J52_01399 [Blattella germanica]